MGFAQLICDKCIYVKVIEDRTVYVGIYVDDILIGSKDSDLIEDVVAELKSRFDLTEHQSLTEILGMSVEFKDESVILSEKGKSSIFRSCLADIVEPHIAVQWLPAIT